MKGAAARGGGAPGEMDPILATLISLIIPGLGLYFVWPEDKKTMAILTAVVLLAADAAVVVIGIILTMVLIGLCCFFFVPVIHLGAAVYTYNEAMKATGGKTLF